MRINSFVDEIHSEHSFRRRRAIVSAFRVSFGMKTCAEPHFCHPKQGLRPGRPAHVSLERLTGSPTLAEQSAVLEVCCIGGVVPFRPGHRCAGSNHGCSIVRIAATNTSFEASSSLLPALLAISRDWKWER